MQFEMDHKKAQMSSNAVGGAAVVMNISNREIISLVSLPYFDPNIKMTNIVLI